MPRLLLILRLTIREIHDQTRSHRFLYLTAVAGLLTPLIVYLGVRDFTTRRVQFTLLAQQPAAMVGTRGPLRMTGRQMEPTLRVTRAPRPTGVLVRGFDGTLPKFWDFAPDGRHTGASGDSASRTPQSGISLDLEFVIRIILGLLAISLATGSLATERESGLLYVLMSQPVHPTDLLAAKLLGGLTAMGLALSVVITGAAAALGVFGPELWSREFECTLLGLSGAGVLYLSALYALGVLIGAVASSVSTANVASLSAWLILVVAAVPTIDVVARVMASVPASDLVESRRQVEFDTQLRATQIAVGRWFAEVTGPHWRESSVADALKDQIRTRWHARSLTLRHDLRRIDDDVIATTAHQWRLWTDVSWATPSSVFFDAATRLAGTGLPTAARWDRATQAYQISLDAALFDDPALVLLLVPTAGTTGLLTVQVRAFPDEATLKQPVQIETSLRTAVSDARWPLGILIAYVVALVSLTFVVFPKTRY